MQRLNNYHHWLSDGTFKVVPLGLLQLYTVNVLVEHSSVSGAYILTTNKAEDTYDRAFTVINFSHTNFYIDIITGFETKCSEWPDQFDAGF